ncbi:MAG TPA: GNAT family N-acetyltransferase [Alphaproteobacteria bacterium]|nr:GNAT family N-acetyltransferase [Alphaproteobacteria bacterium]
MGALHPLDRPVWHALATRQEEFALGSEKARRIVPTCGMFAAAADNSLESQMALASLIPEGDQLWLVEPQAVDPPPGARIVHRATMNQMVLPTKLLLSPTFAAIALRDSDAEEMQALALLTEPGPFLSETHKLGDFFGIRDSGRLVAMAGERLKPPGFTEVSAVCTHPDHRGRGYAGGLMRLVIERIQARGETAFLHVYPHNEKAIALYRELGFVFRRTLTLTVIAHQGF